MVRLERRTPVRMPVTDKQLRKSVSHFVDLDTGVALCGVTYAVDSPQGKAKFWARDESIEAIVGLCYECKIRQHAITIEQRNKKNV